MVSVQRWLMRWSGWVPPKKSLRYATYALAVFLGVLVLLHAFLNNKTSPTTELEVGRGAFIQKNTIRSQKSCHASRIMVLAKMLDCCQESWRLYDCQQIFSGLAECGADGADSETEQQCGRPLKRPLPNFFLTSLAPNSSSAVEPYRRADLAFVHLPKSGGTSIERYLRSRLADGWESHSVPHCGSFHRAVCSANLLSKPNFFYSKRTYGLHNFLVTNRPFLYFTWFREPVSRVVSTYYYIKRTGASLGSHTFPRQLVEPSRDLAAFLRASENLQYPDFDNFNVRLLQFGDDRVLDANFEDYRGIDPSAIPAVNRTHYLVAKSNLRHMAFIGMMEDWRASQEMLDLMLGMRTAVGQTHVNSNPHKLELSEFERGEIERRNRWDLLLHEDAMEIYVQQKKAYLLYKQTYQ